MSRTTLISKRETFAAYPLAQLAAAFAVGILCERYLHPAPFILVAAAALTSILSTVTLLVNTRTTARLLTKSNLRSMATLLLTLTVLLLGSVLALVETSSVPSNQIKSLVESGEIVVGEPVELTGALMRDPEIAPERLYLQLRVDNIRSRASKRNSSSELPEPASAERATTGVVMLLASVPTAIAAQEFARLDLRYGARIRVLTILERADNFRNPGVASFTEYLDRKGYDASGFIKSPLLIERLEDERVFPPLAWLYDWRRRLQVEIDSRFAPETAGVLDAAMLGNRYNLSRSTSERFREGGTFHVLVISGLHITFLGGLVFVVSRRFTRNRVLQFLLSAAVLWAYSLAVGAEPSVVRAALMFTIVLFAPLVSRRAASLNALGGTALALLALRPADLFDPSFQLTFVSVLAIVVFAWPLFEKMSAIGTWRPTRQTPYPPACASWLRSFCEGLFWSEREGERELQRANYSYRLFKTPLAGRLERFHLQRALRYTFQAVVVSISVQLALLPLLIVYFHRVSFASFLLSIAVSLLMAGVAILAAAALLIAQISSTLAAPLIGLANGLNWAMVHSVDPFAKLGAASIRVPEYSGAAALVYAWYYLPLMLLAVLLSRWQPLQLPRSGRRKGVQTVARFAILGQLLAIALLLVHPGSVGQPTGKLRIDFLDVGQGDSALVTFPDNTTLLIDGGGRPGPFQRNQTTEEGEERFQRETRSIGEAVVSEYLWWRGLDHVDYILATHADADHIDGLNDVARNFDVRAALVARTPSRDPEFGRFLNTLTMEQIPVGVIGAGDVLRFGNVTATILWPTALANPDAPSRNNDSIVLRLQYGDCAVLLTGDLEASGEARLLRGDANLRADVMKIAHHGSKTSSTNPLVAAVAPRFAIVSVGQTSIFGHPNPDVVERWKAAGAEVLTTGNSGTITVTTDGQNISLETFIKR